MPFPPDTVVVDTLGVTEAATPLCQGTLFAASFNTTNGWSYPEKQPQPKVGDPDVAEYSNPNQGGSAYNAEVGGLFTVPPGCRMRLTLTKSFSSGTMTVSRYTQYCKSGPTCQGIGSLGCQLAVSTTSCTLSTSSGATVYALRLRRSDGAGSTATASFLTVTLEN